MDESTREILERARVRREMLDKELLKVSPGFSPSRKRSFTVDDSNFKSSQQPATPNLSQIQREDDLAAESHENASDEGDPDTALSRLRARWQKATAAFEEADAENDRAVVAAFADLQQFVPRTVSAVSVHTPEKTSEDQTQAPPLSPGNLVSPSRKRRPLEEFKPFRSSPITAIQGLSTAEKQKNFGSTPVVNGSGAGIHALRDQWEHKIAAATAQQSATTPKSAAKSSAPASSSFLEARQKLDSLVSARQSPLKSAPPSAGKRPFAAFTAAPKPAACVTVSVGFGSASEERATEESVLSVEERRKALLNLRKKWEKASVTGELLDPNNPTADDDDEITSAAVRMFTPRARSRSKSPGPRVAPKSPMAVAKYSESKSNLSPQKAAESVQVKDAKSPHAATQTCGIGNVLETSTTSSSGSVFDSDLDNCLEEAINSCEQQLLEAKVATSKASLALTPIEPLPKTPISAAVADVPCFHSIDDYRNLQRLQAKSPLKQVRIETPKRSTAKNFGSGSSIQKSHSTIATNYKEKIKYLNAEVNKQQSVISQASHALNVCRNSDEFRGSTEEVEAERLLLIATQRRSSCLSELDRIGKQMTEGSSSTSDYGSSSTGSLSISDISVPLKREFINKHINVLNDNDSVLYYFFCLIKHRDQVIHTEMISSDQAIARQQLEFSNYVQISPLPADFTVTLEVYLLHTRKEQISHAEKYHINTLPKKQKNATLFSPSIQQFAGPHGIRTSNFSLVGSVTLGIQSVAKNKFALQGVPFSCPIDNWIIVNLRCVSERSDVEERGFLNMHEEISGVGAWKRYWCLLTNGRLKYWRYPEEETTKEPLGLIDLSYCVNDQVGLVSKGVCARPFTFLLELRAKDFQDNETDRLLISAETKEEFAAWCTCFNVVLRALHLWNPIV